MRFIEKEGAAICRRLSHHSKKAVQVLWWRKGPLEEFEPDMFELLMRTNVSGAFNVGQAVARHMIARGRGKIINTASIQTALARPGIAPYTASKGALGNLTKGMATDWARHGLAVNAIAPGYLIRRSTQRSWPIPSFRAGSGGARRPAAGADWEELTGACIFLASDASSYVNGHILYVDGGMSACL
jgi:gluconate 5-dehydrogenase